MTNRSCCKTQIILNQSKKSNAPHGQMVCVQKVNTKISFDLKHIHSSRTFFKDEFKPVQITRNIQNVAEMGKLKCLV